MTETVKPSRLRRAMIDAAWIYGCVGVGLFVDLVISGLFGGMASRASGISMDWRYETWLFTYRPLERVQWLQGGRFMIAHWVSIGLVAIACYLPIRWWRRRTKS